MQGGHSLNSLQLFFILLPAHEGSKAGIARKLLPLVGDPARPGR